MCSISHDLKAIFIHIPKCGGLFVEKILEDFYDFKTLYFTHENHNEFIDVNNPKHVFEDGNKGFLHLTKQGLLRYYMSSKIHSEKINMDIEKWNQYTKFTIVRNPYDKILSAWKFINKINKTNATFDEFIKSKDTCNAYTYFHAFITQYEQLLNINNDLKLDFIGKFENLNHDLSQIILKLNDKIKHGQAIKNNRKKNSSGDSINYIGYYNDDLIQIVNSLFEIDFIKFGFKKCNNMDELIEDSALYFVSDENFKEKNKVLLDALILNNNLDISAREIECEEETNQKKRNEVEETNKNNDGKENENEKEKEKDLNTLSINGLNINILDKIDSSCKNIIHEASQEPELANIPNLKDLEAIHFAGIMEMFRRASELTKTKSKK
jgi:hypothetical protein